MASALRPTPLAEQPAAGAAAAPRARRVPAPLAALLAATALLGLAWSLVVPAWQAPDENAHYGYVQSLVDGPGLPGDPRRHTYATEQVAAAEAANSDQVAAAPTTKPPWDPAEEAAWQRREAAVTAAQRGDGGGPNPAATNPPLAYLAYAVPYAATSGAGPFTRLWAMRALSVAWLLVTVCAAWLLAGEVVGRRRPLQLAAAAVAGLTPMMTFISATVSTDPLLWTTWTLALWRGVRMLKRGLTPASGAWFLGAVGAACCVKATSFALLPAALVALAIAYRRLDRRRALPSLAPALGALAVTAGGWFAVARILGRQAAAQLSGTATTGAVNVRELASYLWQFYFPRLPFMTDYFTTQLPVYDVMLKGAWGRFGWLEVRFPGPFYWLLGLATVAVAAAAGARLWRGRARMDGGVAALFALAAAGLLAGLHWTEYHVLAAHAGGFMQGRYLLPLVGLGGLALAQALRLLPGRRQAAGAAAAVGALFALQVLSLGLVLVRFYA